MFIVYFSFTCSPWSHSFDINTFVFMQFVTVLCNPELSLPDFHVIPCYCISKINPNCQAHNWKKVLKISWSPITSSYSPEEGYERGEEEHDFARTRTGDVLGLRLKMNLGMSWQGNPCPAIDSVPYDGWNDYTIPHDAPVVFCFMLGS